MPTYIQSRAKSIRGKMADVKIELSRYFELKKKSNKLKQLTFNTS